MIDVTEEVIAMCLTNFIRIERVISKCIQLWFGMPAIWLISTSAIFLGLDDKLFAIHCLLVTRYIRVLTNP